MANVINVSLTSIGLSAYASAVNGGYTGTEAEFYADLAAIDGLAALAAELEAIVG